MTNVTEKYPVLIRLLHWFMAVSILGLIFSGWYMAGLPDDAPNKYDLYPLHKSFGALMVFSIIARIAVRLAKWREIPALPASLQKWEITVSHLAHVGLYLLMVLVPVSGYIMSSAYTYGSGIDFFWTKLPDAVEKSEAVSGFFHSFHGPLAYALLGLIVLHVAGAIKHRFFDAPESDVLKRML